MPKHIITPEQLHKYHTDTIITSSMGETEDKKLIIRTFLDKNQFGNTRANTYFMVFNKDIIKCNTLYLDEAIKIYNKL